MSIQSDNKIKKIIRERKVIIEPYVLAMQGPNLYYCHISENFLIPITNTSFLDPMKKIYSKKYFKQIRTNEYVIKPGEYILAESFESFGVSREYIIKLYNSSSLARCGVGHLALGMINPGCGMEKPIKITLEIFNTAPFPIKLIASKINHGKILFGTEVYKVSIEKISGKVSVGYSDWSHGIYSKSDTVEFSKMNQRYDTKEYDYEK